MGFSLAQTSEAHAADVRKADRIEVGDDEVIDDALIAFGDSVEIDGWVRGDVVVFARIVTVRGKVDGNLFAFAQQVDVFGPVSGSVVTAAEDVAIAGRLATQLYAAGETVEVREEGDVSGDAMLAASLVVVTGNIGRDVYAAGEHIEIVGKLQRDFVAAGSDIHLGDTSSVGRDVKVTVPESKALRVDTNANVTGSTVVDVGVPQMDRQYQQAGYYFWRLAMIAGGLVFGVLAFAVAPMLFRSPLQRGPLLRALGVGIVGLIAVPLGSAIVAATVVGIPLAITAIGAFALALYLGKLIVAAELGRRILRVENVTRGDFVRSLLLGLVLVSIATQLPFVGGVFGVGIAIVGLGVMLGYLERWRQHGRNASMP